MSCLPPHPTTRDHARNIDPHISMGSWRDRQRKVGVGERRHNWIRDSCRFHQRVSRPIKTRLICSWDTEILRRALVDPVCSTSDDITFQECPVFQPFIKTGSCRPEKGVLTESFAHNNLVPIAKLPGCNPLWTSGPKPGCSSSPPDPDATAFRGTDGPMVTKNSSIPALPILPGWKQVTCIKSSDNMLSNQVRSYDSSVSQTTCLDSCLRSGYSYASIGKAWGTTWVCLWLELGPRS